MYIISELPLGLVCVQLNVIHSDVSQMQNKYNDTCYILE